LPPAQAAGVLKQCSPEEQKDIIVRMANMQRIDREVLSRIDQTLRERAKDSATLLHEEIDGRSSLANIMRFLDPSLEQNLLDDLATEAPDLAQDIRERLFTIETILLIDDKDLQKVLSNLDDKLIAMLLKGKSDAIRKKMLSNVSESRAGMIRDEYSLMGPQPRRDVDQVTREFIATLKILENDGTIRVRREDDEYV
jgi:flagellar motor switch protein FliG